MKPSDFNFELPEALIAHYPAAERSASRLLVLERHGGALDHRRFHELPELLHPDDLLVFNDTRVIPARLFGHKPSGGKIEVLLERMLADNRVLAQIRGGQRLRADSLLRFPDGATTEQAQVLGREDGFFLLQFSPALNLSAFLNRIGHMPLPPYIKRADENQDSERYQTVYARHSGAVAAPTAGLHFDTPLLQTLAQRGIRSAYVTLHVGAGTFQPVRVDDVREHRMHAEYLEVSEETCAAVAACRARGGRVIAVGTTAVRCLETASQHGRLEPYQGDTRIFIYPGYRFRCVDALITNFHLPQSTLLMLVSAFSSREHILAAYRLAVVEQYRFFSYGDAMFIA